MPLDGSDWWEAFEVRLFNSHSRLLIEGFLCLLLFFIVGSWLYTFPPIIS